MARTISSGMQTELAAATMRPVYLVEIGLNASTLYLSSLGRDVSWNSHTWLGNGWLRKPRAINETSGIRAVGFEIELVGVNEALLALMLVDADQSKDAIVRLGMLDSSGAVISTPVTTFSGKVDSVEIIDAIEEPSVIVKCESSLARLLRPANFRYTDGNQQALFSGDKGFQFVPQLEEFSGFWGKAERPKWLRRRRRATK